MANLITLSRFVLLLLVVLSTYYAPPMWHLVNVGLLVLMFVSDAVDGVVARKLNESSRFGAVFDIAMDRVVELTLWVMFTALGLVGLWVPLVFIIRGTVTDSIRAAQVAEHGKQPFNMLTTRVGKWLVAGRFMRASYGTLKAITFCWLMLVYAIRGLDLALPAWTSTLFQSIATTLVVSSVAVCVLRGLPVVIEFLQSERENLLGSLTRDTVRVSGR